MPVNREIEVKLPVPNVREIAIRLRRIGAKRAARVFESNTLWDTEDEYFKSRLAILRIRHEQQTHSGLTRRPRRFPHPRRKEGRLTFKGPIAGHSNPAGRYKERDEVEFRLKDASRFARLLRRIGMRPWFRYEKFRTRYAAPFPGLCIELDETPIGVFLELEGPRRSIDLAARALGYCVADYIAVSYLELYAAECSRRGIQPKNMLF